jgi:hypothetical protein
MVVSSFSVVATRKYLSKGFAAFLTAMLLICLPLCGAQADADLRLPRVVVDNAGPYTSANLNVQKFYDTIVIPPAYLRQPLSMVCTNGSVTAPGFSWVRMFLLPDKSDADYQNVQEPLGRMIINEDSFLSTAQVYLDLSGQFSPGQHRICVEAAGRVGAVFSWEIRSIGKPVLFMAPRTGTTAGAWFDVPGYGFSLRPAENTVQLGPVTLPVAESNGRVLRVFIPKGFPAGDYDFSVSIRSFQSRVVKLEIVAPKGQH